MISDGGDGPSYPKTNRLSTTTAALRSWENDQCRIRDAGHRPGEPPLWHRGEWDERQGAAVLDGTQETNPFTRAGEVPGMRLGHANSKRQTVSTNIDPFMPKI